MNADQAAKEGLDVAVKAGDAGAPDRLRLKAAEDPERSAAARRRLRLTHETVVWALFLLLIPASRVVSSSFPSGDQIENILTLGLFLVVIAFGQGLVLLSGGIDLSVPGVVTTSAFTMAAYTEGGGSVMVGLALALLAAAGIGAVNGLGIAYLRIPPFIMTLAIGTITASALLGLNQGTPSRPSPPVLRDLFSGREDLLGIPTPIYFFVGVVFVGWVIQHLTTYGRKVYATGDGELPARISGLRVAAQEASVYVVAAIAYGIGGVMLLGFADGVQLTLGDEWLLPSIAAVLVGGTSIRGGQGSYMGTVAGVLLLTTVATDISASGFPEGWEQVLYGAIVLGALLLARTRRLRLRMPRFGTRAA